MAYAMTKQGSLDNCVTYEFMCDTVEDMNAIEDRYRTIGSVAIVLQGNSGLEVYIASSDKQWNSFSGTGAGSGAGAGLSIHICGQSEVENGLPSVSEPDEATIYLVPASDSSSGNLYDEYVYVAEAWEKFGSGGVSNDLPITYEQTVLEFEDVVNGDMNNPPQSEEEFTAITKQIVIEDTTKLTNGTGILQVGDNKYQITIMTNQSTIAGRTLDKETGRPTREAVFNIIIEQPELTTNVPAKLIVADANNTPNETYPVRIEFRGALYSTAPAFYLQDVQVITENALRDYLGQTLGYYLRNYVTVSNLSKYAPINNPAFTGHISLGRKSDSSIGDNSIATGNNTTASGYTSHTEGNYTTASGDYTHAEGSYTTAAGDYSHVSGIYNIEDSFVNWSEWTANTSYEVGDKVKRTSGSGTSQTVTGYICKTANSDASFTSSKWTNQNGKMNYAEIIGNGTSASARSNARALDWDGNEYLKGDLYVGCNADSTGGAKVATEAYVNARIPTPPTTNGTYILQAVVADGTTTYSWINLPAAQGVSF